MRFPTPETRAELDQIIDAWARDRAHSAINPIGLVEWLAMHGVRLVPEEPLDEQLTGDLEDEEALDAYHCAIDASPFAPIQKGVAA